mmetsp:Transcript_60199/g.167986  ORF Transcript_60199/g.167986 Transcript_60199/m.167986 type:complete len:214 (+) Transcript_60199:948-1589(+)
MRCHCGMCFLRGGRHVQIPFRCLLQLRVHDQLGAPLELIQHRHVRRARCWPIVVVLALFPRPHVDRNHRDSLTPVDPFRVAKRTFGGPVTGRQQITEQSREPRRCVRKRVGIGCKDGCEVHVRGNGDDRVFRERSLQVGAAEQFQHFAEVLGKHHVEKINVLDILRRHSNHRRGVVEDCYVRTVPQAECAAGREVNVPIHQQNAPRLLRQEMG